MESSVQRTTGITLVSLLISAAVAGAALAQSGSAGGSIGNDEKSLSGSREAPRAVEPPRPARRAKPEPDEPRRASRKSSGGGGGGEDGRGSGGNFDGTWVAVAVGTPCGSSSERVCHLRWQDIGRAELRVGQPQWLREDRRVRTRFELEQLRPFLGPHRLRLVRAIRRLYRTLDRFQTVENVQNGRKTPCFCGFSLPQLWLSTGLNYTPSAPELRLIATPLSDQIECTKRCVSVPGL